MADEINPGMQFIATYWPLLAVLAIIITIIFFVLSHRRNELEFKPFKPQPLHKTLDQELKEKLRFFGSNHHGDLYISYQKIASLRKFMQLKGQFAIQEYNPKDRTIKVLKSKDGNREAINYDLLVMEALSKNPIIRIFSLGLLGRFKIIIKHDGSLKADDQHIILPIGTDMMRYGKVWVNSEGGVEYLNDISIKRMLEQTQMHLENFPDKTVHIELEQAKKERIRMREAEIKKAGYEEAKNAGDTTIEA